MTRAVAGRGPAAGCHVDIPRADGASGPLCEHCTDQTYFDKYEGACVECPEMRTAAAALGASLGAATYARGRLKPACWRGVQGRWTCDLKIKSPPTFELFMPPSNPLARGIGTLSYRRFATFLNTYTSEK